ncbi:hypothetical protein [Clostridium tarantellae]|uniref:Nal1 N-terminal domain-containing protein n=1 Tax=Clostridium tarantellae TaxID=39493 RepID=A0A6I1MMF2_9CLOT|nr:hypothetical protein [Clostridium tarantellae]MPQ43297.1 hypothetical protein [Clostridium tarantellae]
MIEDSIKNIIKNYSSFFHNKKNVLGVALGYKHIKNINTNIPSLHVFVKKKIPINKLFKDELIPENFLGIKTDVIECGEINIFNNHTKSVNNKYILKPQFLISKVRPLQAGFSIGPLFHRHSGTLGCIVFDNKRNKPHILGNNHVLTYFNKMPKGTPILQPSLKDSNATLFNTVATLTKFVSLNFKKSEYDKRSKNEVDCAIAKLNPGIKYTKNIYKIGPVLNYTDAKLETYVQKSGRTTGYTIGTIDSINASFSIGKDSFAAYFENLIITSKMCEAGDSGAMVMDFSNRALGIILGSSEQKSFVIPIKPILKLLDIHF